jgi:hypothetical protein
LLGLLVDLIGIEPMTSSMPWKRAPSCATGPLLGRTLSILADCNTFVNATGNWGVVQFDCCASGHSFSRAANAAARIAASAAEVHFLKLTRDRELIGYLPVSKSYRVSEHSAAGGAVLQSL